MSTPPVVNVMLPVGVPAPGGCTLTVAVNVSPVPGTAGLPVMLGALTTATVVAAGLTVWISDDMTGAKFPVGTYCASTSKLLTGELAIPSVATPAAFSGTSGDTEWFTVKITPPVGTAPLEDVIATVI